MNKRILDLVVKHREELNANYVLLKATQNDKLPEMLPGQFAQLRVDDEPAVMLRRPISINYVDYDKNEVWFLIQIAGKGTAKLAETKVGETLNAILPLGSTFTLPEDTTQSLLLVGGGVGVAPLLFLGGELKKRGFNPIFLLGARTHKDLLQLSDFERFGQVLTTTEDGSHGEKGFVTAHSVLQEASFDMIYTCGPRPMMKAVAALAKQKGIECEVSLENMMACGIGACLCCVEETTRGNVCTCTEGPVFNTKELLW
ncbi:MAG: dihydroorotate dehydrogenase electron transfer subunit [Bacteroidales bacterium]|nr:dihydroorotate dehydrogenase electron transfer subunit [Bacteroidales bacterium]